MDACMKWISVCQNRLLLRLEFDLDNVCVHLFIIHLVTLLCVHPAIHTFSLPTHLLPIHTSFHPFIYPSNQPSIHPSTHPSTQLSIQPSIYPSISTSIHSTIHPSIHPPIHFHSFTHSFIIYQPIETSAYLSIYASHSAYLSVWF